MSESRKRKQKYIGHASKRGRACGLHTGMKGLLLTCNDTSKEGVAVRETLGLLKQFVDEEQQAKQQPEDGATTGNGQGGATSVADELQRELEELRNSGKSDKGGAAKPQQYRRIDTSSRGLIFLDCSTTDPTVAAQKIFQGIIASGKPHCRFLSRLTPITHVCQANMEEIKLNTTRMLQATLLDKGCPASTFAIQYKARNTTLKREDVITEVATIAADGGRHTVDLDNARYNIFVEIMTTMCGLGVVTDYHEQSRYSMHRLGLRLEPASADGTAAKGKGEGKGEGKGKAKAKGKSEKEVEEEEVEEENEEEEDVEEEEEEDEAN
eukprot:m.55356 g.55356  ORF g.55356 m.55356 type:complete len:324 (-) comp13307_c0_seq1:148-1119(-)